MSNITEHNHNSTAPTEQTTPAQNGHKLITIAGRTITGPLLFFQPPDEHARPTRLYVAGVFGNHSLVVIETTDGCFWLSGNRYDLAETLSKIALQLSRFDEGGR